MQRIGNDFTQKRSAQVYSKDGGGMIKEAIELPNGQWQFGKGKDAQVITDVEQVKEFGEDVQTAVAGWLKRTQHLPTPSPVVAGGPIPLIAGHTVKDQLTHAIQNMPDDVAARILSAITQTVAPVADSINQEAPVNHHSDGFGQDQASHVPGGIPAATDDLPSGAWWVDASNKAAGYYTPNYTITEKAKLPSGEIVDVPTKTWHPTATFQRMQDKAPDKSDAELEMEAEREKFLATQHEEPVSTGGRSPRRRR